MADLTSNYPGDKSEETILPYEQEASAPPHDTQAIASISVEQRKDESLKSLELPQGSSNTGDSFEGLNERQPNDSIDDARPVSNSGGKQDGETSDAAKSHVEDSDLLIEKSHTVGMESEVTEKEDEHEHNDETESLRNSSPETNKRLLDAAQEGDEEGVRRALVKGAEIETRNTLGETALHLACRFSHEHIVTLLLKVGANIEARDNDGWTPLISAICQEASMDILRLLFDQEKHPDIDARSESGWTALMYACWNTDSAVVNFLLSRKPDTNFSDYAGSTALTLACGNSTAEIVSALLKARADVNAQNGNGDTPLILASRWRDANMVSNILEYNPDISKVGDDGVTALHRVMWNEKKDEIVPLLVQAPGVDINAKDSEK
ncbi:hypothetical protein BGAL_0072g00160 [Botrytis galanthina]|uniref:Uncharacterized protein n=1 Tax=Botrytis galanthina TaxID=278940 RepID=A0A4S8R566_9HELO|nr:hypothetical protein BGAL_0072g00160 [Botrytis galanthina]